MKNLPEENEPEIRIIHDGKFYFSVFEGRHPSWCDLKVLQGEHKTLVILSQPQGYIGTFIANAIEHLVAQISNVFGLDPGTTMYLHYTPPTIPSWFYERNTDDPLAKIARHAFGPSDEKYERIIIKWVKSERGESVLEQYHVHELPDWKLISPSEAAKLPQELNIQ